jgi:hypothetical protein
VAKKKSYKQGLYTPTNPGKYVGDLNKIMFRSSWELDFNKYLDHNPNIVRWASEEIHIPYIKPTTGRTHKYFPDYWIEYVDRQGQLVQELIEIKPSNQVEVSKRRLSEGEKVTYAINQAKWQFAQAWCNQRGLLFRILTEKQLFASNDGTKNGQRRKVSRRRATNRTPTRRRV